MDGLSCTDVDELVLQEVCVQQSSVELKRENFHAWYQKLSDFTMHKLNPEGISFFYVIRNAIKIE